jgi:hypothetical protein
VRAKDVLLILPAQKGPFPAGNMVFFHAEHGFSMGFASSTNLSTGDRRSDSIETCPASENVSESMRVQKISLLKSSTRELFPASPKKPACSVLRVSLYAHHGYDICI